MLAHDWIVARRGGEQVLEAIARALSPGCEIVALLTMVDRGVALGPATDPLPRHISPLQRVPERLRRWALPAYPLAVGSLSRTLRTLHSRRPIDLLISTSSAAIKALRPPQGVPHLCYCHAPARYVWSHASEYRGGRSLLDRARAAGLALARGPYRSWDRATAPRVDRFLANSSAVASQIDRAYGRGSTVVHPPVRTDVFTPASQHTERKGWLVVSALEPYKRVDLAVRAAAHAGARLSVVGDGSQRASLEVLARECGADVTFEGFVPDEQVIDAMRGARLLLFPQIEDFGITAVEALACGTPVVARAAGGALDTVSDEVGALVNDATPGAFAAAATRVASDPPPPDACRARAMVFSSERFESQIRAHANSLLGSVRATGTPTPNHASGHRET